MPSYPGTGPGHGRLALAAAVAAPLAAPPVIAAAEPNFPSSKGGYHNFPEMVTEIKAAATF